jgi:thioredoxin-like negative regulator of GroEL
MCAHVDGQALAPKHFDTRFIRINVDNAPFLVTRLKVQVLPCVIAFVDGVGKDRIIGFEGLGQGDRFTTMDLEARLLATGVLTRAKISEDAAMARSRQETQREEEYDDDD